MQIYRRAGTVLASIFIIFATAWSSGKFVLDWVGRLDAAQELLAPHSVAGLGFRWLFSTPWWAPAVIASLMAILVGWSIFLPETATPADQAGAPAVSKASNRRTIIDMLITDGSEQRLPECRASFGRNGSDLMFLIEYSAFFHHVMGGPNGWTARRKFPIHEVKRYARGETVSFPIISRISEKWKVGLDNNPTDIITDNVSYKGRIVALDNEDNEQYVYFIILPRGVAVPMVIGQHMFDHKMEWEGGEPNYKAEALFR